MLVVLLFGVCCLSCVVCALLCYLLCVVCGRCSLRVVRCVLCAAYNLLSSDCFGCFVFVAGCLRFVVCRGRLLFSVLRVACRFLIVCVVVVC